MRAIWAMAIKDLKLLYSDKVGFFFVWFYPVLFSVFFGYVLKNVMSGGGKGMGAVSIAVVDEDKTESSQKLVEQLKAEESFYIEDAESRDDAIQKVRSAKKPVSLIIPEGYGDLARNIFAGDPPELEMITDPARPMESGITEGLVTAIGFKRIQDMFSDKGIMLDQLQMCREEIQKADGINVIQRAILLKFMDDSASFFQDFSFHDEANTNGEAGTNGEASSNGSAGGFGGWNPIRLTKQSVADIPVAGEPEDEPKKKLSSYAIVLPQAIAWGVMACAATFALSLVIEQTKGTLPRLQIAPLKTWQILAGKALSCSITTMSVIIGMLLLGRVAMGVVPVSPMLLLPAIMCVTVAIVGVMMLMSVLGRTEAAVGGISWAVLVIMAMFGGGMIPLSQMRGFLAQVSHLSVFRWAILAIEGAVWRGYTPAEMVTPCAVLLSIGFGGFLIGAIIFSRRT